MWRERAVAARSLLLCSARGAAAAGCYQDIFAFGCIGCICCIGWMFRLLIVFFALVSVHCFNDFEKTHIVSWDGTKLVARIYEPQELQDNETICIYINSWGLPSLEYIQVMRKIIGLRSIEYETRGFWGSDGTIQLAGPEDVADVNSVIDFALNYWGNRNRVALIGVSYGGGLSLLAAANDTRVTTVVAFSAWVSLYNNFNWNSSPSRIWANILIGLGEITGNLDPSIFQIWNYVKTQTNLTYVAAWCQKRDPVDVVANLARVPVLMLSDLDDGLMLSQLSYDFWASALQSERKAFIFAGGTHAQKELPGIFGIEERSYGPFHQARDWILNRSTAPFKQLSFYDLENVWPYDDYGLDLYNTTRPPTSPYIFSLSSPSNKYSRFGSLDSAATVNDKTKDNTMSLRFGFSHLSPGDIPVLSDFLKPRLKMPAADLGAASRQETSIVFLSSNIFSDDDYVISGVPELSGLSVIPSDSSFQFYVYLYTANPSGLLNDDRNILGRLVTYVPFSIWNNATPGEPFYVPSLQFTAAAFRIPRNHRLALGFSMLSNLYSSNQRV